MIALSEFAAVPVMPVTRLTGHVALGGPIWPDFEAQTKPRHCRGSYEPVDRRPPLQRHTGRYRRPAIWGGFLDPQFGHLIAEHLSRLLPALTQRPQDLVLFTVMPGTTEASLPGYIRGVLDWLGVNPRALRLVTEPRTAPELRVAPQAEMLGSRPPEPEYLDLLDELPDRHGLVPPRRAVVYVGRPGMVARGAGGHLGEGYLIGLLQNLGVTVIDPAALSVRAQMEHYLGAEHLVFAEGSAIHGRQLLGRLDQDVHILQRRPGFNVGRHTMTPRCRHLGVHDVCGRRLKAFAGGRGRTVRDLMNISCAFYNPEALIATFATMGIDLRPHWNQKHYVDQALADADGWFAAHPDRQDLSHTRNARAIEEELQFHPFRPGASAKSASAGPALH